MGSVPGVEELVSKSIFIVKATILTRCCSYSSSDDIQEYMEKVADDFDLRKYFKLNHEIIGARWEEETAHWIITIRRNGDDSDVFEDWCDFFANGSGKLGESLPFAAPCSYELPFAGLLNAWKWPDIEGLQTFKGTLLHTAAYDRSVDLDGKKVALIGVGSSAVQVLPVIQPRVGVGFRFYGMLQSMH
jgi:cation diffusion facilitator CzcD-associated flavoprotein CzcO